MSQLEGKTIETVRRMTDEEMEREGWQSSMYGHPPMLVLENGTKLYPSMDPEGNGPGALFGDSGNELFMVATSE